MRPLEQSASPAGVRLAAQDLLQRLFDAEAVFVASADPETWLITEAASLNVPADATPRFLDNEYAADDVVKFRHLASAELPVGTLQRCTRGDLPTSARWRDVLEPLGWGDEMRAALRVDGRTWGFVCLHRAAGQAAYSAADVRRLVALVPSLAQQLRRTANQAARAADEQRRTTMPGLMLLGDHGEVVARNEMADDWLDELRAPGEAGVPVVLQGLARAVPSAGGTTVHLRTDSGRWATLHASLVTGRESARVSVVVEETRPDAMMPRLATAVGLTPREQEIVVAVLRGLSTRAMASMLFISEHTVQTHLRSVFAKTGVHSRGELVARVMSGR
jgi:DNA-binding CsgD family transcriptional regulator